MINVTAVARGLRISKNDIRCVYFCAIGEECHIIIIRPRILHRLVMPMPRRAKESTANFSQPPPEGVLDLVPNRQGAI